MVKTYVLDSTCDLNLFIVSFSAVWKFPVAILHKYTQVPVKMEKDDAERKFGVFKKLFGNRVLHFNISDPSASSSPKAEPRRQRTASKTKPSSQS